MNAAEESPEQHSRCIVFVKKYLENLQIFGEKMEKRSQFTAVQQRVKNHRLTWNYTLNLNVWLQFVGFVQSRSPLFAAVPNLGVICRTRSYVR